MVYAGPSNGCRQCRAKHTKCDESRPACQKCTRRGIKCPGFDHSPGIIIKDVTSTVVSRYARRSRVLAQSNPTDPVQHLIGLDQRISVPGHEKLNDTIKFFFDTFILSSPPGRTPYLFFEYLAPIYLSSSPSSCITPVIRALAEEALLRQPDARRLMAKGAIRALQEKVAALQAIQTSLDDPSKADQDETLLAVLCLDFLEGLTPRHDLSLTARHPHLHGAVVLIQHRQISSFNSDFGSSLLAGVTNELLMAALEVPGSGEYRMLASMQAPCQEFRARHAQSALQSFVIRLSKMDREIVYEPHAHEVTSLFGAKERFKALDLYDEILDWIWEFSDTLGNATSEYLHKPKTGTTLGLEHDQDRLSMPINIAWLLLQWHCTQIMALRVLYATSEARAFDWRRDTMEPYNILHALRSTLERIVELLLTLRKKESWEGKHYCRKIICWVKAMLVYEDGLVPGFAVEDQLLETLLSLRAADSLQ